MIKILGLGTTFRRKQADTMKSDSRDLMTETISVETLFYTPSRLTQNVKSDFQLSARILTVACTIKVL